MSWSQRDLRWRGEQGDLMYLLRAWWCDLFGHRYEKIDTPTGEIEVCRRCDGER